MKAEDILIHVANRKDVNRLEAYREDAVFAEREDFADLSHLLIAEENGAFRGFLQYGMFKNRLPFMQKLYVIPSLRGKGYATAIIRAWEGMMRTEGYASVMVTSSSLSSAQNFYRLMGYRDIGSFMLPGEPLEMIFIKRLDAGDDPAASQ